MTKKSKDTKGKGNARGTSEPVKSDVETDTKGDNLEYLVHLQKVHKCNLLGHVVKKEVKKGKPGKYPKGQGKH